MSDVDNSLSLPDSDLHFPVVGIGASAGGLSALIRFFESVTTTPGMAFVVVLHLSPKHESNAAAILQRATKMTVAQVTGEIKIAPDHVYVIAPTHSLLMVDGMLHLGAAERIRGGHVVIDQFFRTLARAHRERAVAIVLSGTGADGAVGIAEIKEHGGVVIAQSPQDAEYVGMPSSAILTGKVDLILPAADMGQKLLDIWANAQTIELPKSADIEIQALPPSSPAAAEKALARIMGLLQSSTNHNFKHYKRATVLRRIERRLQVNSLPHLPAYADYLEHHPEEVPLLLADMLIGVTSFFRDREAFEALERNVIPQLFNEEFQDEQLRVWTPGCSTGEEAYSLAMLLAQEASSTSAIRPLQVFATDIDEPAIARGRDGAYPESIVTDIAPAILRRYFVKEGLNYRVAKSLRDHVLFAPHNVLRDPPFSRLDLISCRNLLIYLEREVQAEILQMFHFALRPGGYLFLGSSETADASDRLFTTVDKKHRIYRANTAVRAARSLPRFPLGSHTPVSPPLPWREPGPRQLPAIGDLHNQLLLECAPPSIVVSDDGEILHVARAEHLLRFSAGIPTQVLMSVIQPELKPALRAAMFDASQQEGESQATATLLQGGGKARQINVVVRPVKHPDWSKELKLILFHESDIKRDHEGDDGRHETHDPLIANLESELQRKDAQLQRSIGQYEVSLEDLKASNEELQAINEELRSATEELETSKEELQSTNEELITVNQELKTKVEETAETNDDLRNLIASTGIATIFVEGDMSIKRFTPVAAELFNLISSDTGRSLMDITHKLNYDDLAGDVAETFNTLRVVEREVSSQDGRTFLAHLQPYRTEEDRIGGAVLSFVDVTALRRAQRSVHIDQERMALIAQSMPGFAIMTMDEKGCFTSWSIGAKELFGYDEAEVIGKSCAIIFTPEDRAAGAPEQGMHEARQAGQASDERWHLRKDGRRVFVSGIIASMKLGHLQGFAKIARNMTASKQAERNRAAAVESALDSAARANAASDMKDEFLAVMSHELKHPLNLIQVSAQMLAAMPETQPHARVLKAARSIQASVKTQARIIDDLLDLSRTRAGKLVLNVAPLYLNEALQGCFEWAATQATAKGITFEMDAQDESLLLDGDLVRIEQIAMNLLSNALKFTPSGGSITVQLAREGDDAVLRVTDSGRGISAAFLPHVFGLFRQADSHTTRQEGGLGIGLALVNELVRLHRGRVAAASEGEGLGSTFAVYLPLKSSNSDFGALGHLPDIASLAGVRMLVVDDSADALDIFCELLRMEGAEVTSASSGQQALACAERADFDLVISDIGMPGMDGLMLMRELRKLPCAAKVRAIALTGYGRTQDVSLCLSSGFDAHLNKPVEIQRLKEVMADLGLMIKA
jgi:two-component system CheB/CheR fusion protein